MAEADGEVSDTLPTHARRPPRTESFLSLPSALRKEILSYILTQGNLYTAPRSRSQTKFLPLGTGLYTGSDTKCANALFTNPLLHISQTLRREALSVIVSTNVFKLESALRLGHFLEYLGPELMQELRFLWFGLIPWGWAFDPKTAEQEADIVTTLKLLATCRNLEYIKVEIEPIWALHEECFAESLWTLEELAGFPVFAGLAKLRAITAEVEWRDYETDWYDGANYNGSAFTYFRDRQCDHTVGEAHALLAQMIVWLEDAIERPKSESLNSDEFLSIKIPNLAQTGVFRLLDLPRELRDQIYSYILVPPNFLRLIPADSCDGDWDQETMFPLSTQCRSMAIMQHPILFVNHQIRVEAEEELYSSNTFKIPSLQRLEVFLVYLGPYRFKYLTSLAISIQQGYPAWSREVEDVGPPFPRMWEQLASCTKLIKLSLFLDVCFLLERRPGHRVVWHVLEPFQLVYNNIILKSLVAYIRGLRIFELKWAALFVSTGQELSEKLPLWMEQVEVWLRERLMMPRDAQ